MKNLRLINKNTEAYAKTKLSHFYNKEIIPPEKKEYITDLESSVGPYMGIEDSDGRPSYLLDAASQIATLGLGFNSLPFFAPGLHLESYLNSNRTKKFSSVRTSFENFLQRKLNWDSISTTFCHSGAEANEIALGDCYKKRVNKNANKVLAFEGSFHGRMLISLSSTWNPAKRAPFEWDEYLTHFCPYPNSKSDRLNVEFDKNWLAQWETKAPLGEDKSTNDLEKLEFSCLSKVKEELETAKIFAIIIEPMQCEGGDQYATNRFYSALICLSKAYQVPIIFDEVQTGYHLGNSFFWHRQFDLTDSKGNTLTPNYVNCAKKAQIGLVISHDRINTEEEFQVASFFRGYSHAIALEQSKESIKNIEGLWRSELNKFIEKYNEFASSPRGLGLSFAFDIQNKEHVSTFISKRFNYGLLYYPAGDKTLRFRLNTAFTKSDIEFLFSQLDSIAAEVFLGDEESSHLTKREFEKETAKNQSTYNWVRLITKELVQDTTQSSLINDIKKNLKLKEDEELIELNSTNFNQWKDGIQNIQEETYEKTRQTDSSLFEQIISHPESISLGVTKGEKLSAICISCLPSLVSHERGLENHEDLNNSNALYTADTTVLSTLRGRSLGRNLKFATVLLGLSKNKNIFIGRNRSILAKDMQLINLALGGYEYKFVENDYPDELNPKDVIHYKIELKNNDANIPFIGDFSQSPLSPSQLNHDFLNQSTSIINNKICLSNFVSESFLSDLDFIIDLAPKGLKHGYSASGQSECVDKIVKSIWFKDKKGKKMLTFDGHFFGSGSFLSRSLSSSEDPFFPVKHLPHPTEENWHNVIGLIKQELQAESYLGVWIEPVRQMYQDKVPTEFLIELRKITKSAHVPLVFNETSSRNFHYDNSKYFAANDNYLPDAMMSYLGGQIAVIHISKEYFLQQPLMLISTWDGDEFSLKNAVTSIKYELENHQQLGELSKRFEEKISSILQEHNIKDLQVDGLKGRFTGKISNDLKSIFQDRGTHFTFSTNISNAEYFLKTWN